MILELTGQTQIIVIDCQNFVDERSNRSRFAHDFCGSIEKICKTNKTCKISLCEQENRGRNIQSNA